MGKLRDLLFGAKATAGSNNSFEKIVEALGDLKMRLHHVYYDEFDYNIKELTMQFNTLSEINKSKNKKVENERKVILGAVVDSLEKFDMVPGKYGESLINTIFRHIMTLADDYAAGSSFFTTKTALAEFKDSFDRLAELNKKLADYYKNIDYNQSIINKNNERIMKSFDEHEMKRLSEESKACKVKINAQEQLISQINQQIAKINVYLEYLEKLANIKASNQNDYANKFKEISKEYVKEINIDKVQDELFKENLERVMDAEEEVYSRKSAYDVKMDNINERNQSNDSNLDSLYGDEDKDESVEDKRNKYLV